MKQFLKKFNWLLVARMVVVLTMVLSPLALSSALSVDTAHAQFINDFDDACEGTGVRCGDDVDLPELFKTVINYALGIAFFVAVIYLIYGGFLYITSAGNEESAEKGKNAIVYALIGIVVIVLSFVIVSAVYRFVANNG